MKRLFFNLDVSLCMKQAIKRDYQSSALCEISTFASLLNSFVVLNKFHRFCKQTLPSARLANKVWDFKSLNMVFFADLKCR